MCIYRERDPYPYPYSWPWLMGHGPWPLTIGHGHWPWPGVKTNKVKHQLAFVCQSANRLVSWPVGALKSAACQQNRKRPGSQGAVEGQGPG